MFFLAYTTTKGIYVEEGTTRDLIVFLGTDWTELYYHRTTIASLNNYRHIIIVISIYVLTLHTPFPNKRMKIPGKTKWEEEKNEIRRETVIYFWADWLSSTVHGFCALTLLLLDDYNKKHSFLLKHARLLRYMRIEDIKYIKSICLWSTWRVVKISCLHGF